MNFAFQQQTGFLRSAIGRAVSEVTPGLSEAKDSWIYAAFRVASTGKPEKISYYSKFLNMWFMHSLSSCERDFFTMMMNDISQPMYQYKKYMFSGADEHMFPGEMSVSLIYDDWNRPAGYIGIAKDISERKKMEEDIRNLAHEYEIIFNGTQDSLFLIDVAPDDKFKFRYNKFNKVKEKLTGVSSKKSRGLTPTEAYGDQTGMQLEVNYERCLNAKKTISYEETVTFAAGTKTWYTTLSPIVSSGKVKNIVGSSRDITRQKQIEEALEKEREFLKRSEEKFNKAFNSSPISIAISSLSEGIYLEANNTFLEVFGFSREELIGHSSLDLNIWFERSDRSAMVQVLMAKGSVRNREIKFRNKAGEIRDFLTNIEMISFGNDQCLIFSLSDITERKKTEIIGDLNGLKLTNDVFGHSEGDRLLQKLACILKESFRKEDIVARWGGYEFAVILPKTSSEKAAEICERITGLCVEAGQDPIQPSIALGYAAKDNEFQDIQQTLKESEKLMYRHKLLDNRSVRSSIIASLQKTLFERSYETEEHAQRIKNVSTRLGLALGLSGTDMDELGLLSLLHDIGKIAVPDSILMKPDKLSPDEWEEMKKHAEIGYRIAHSSQELSHIAEYILSHHERWDGHGYPRGLKGAEIPKLSRIISIVDAYDVMTHTGPYKGAMSHEEAIEEILRCSGKQFDPQIANVFVTVMNKLG